MIAVELFIVLLFIFLRPGGGIGIGFAGGAGVIALSYSWCSNKPIFLSSRSA